MGPISLARLFEKAETPAELWSWLLGRQLSKVKWQYLPWTNARYENTASCNDVLSGTLCFLTDFWGRGTLCWAELAVRAR